MRQAEIAISDVANEGLWRRDNPAGQPLGDQYGGAAGGEATSTHP